MVNIFQPVLLLIAGATQRELARQIKYLKVENEILRSKLPARITVTAKERQRLVKFAQKLGKAIHLLATIVTPATVLRWIREDRGGKKLKEPVRRGRPKTDNQIRKLILKMARENEWGYTRILGELKKLGINSVSRNTVKRILIANGLDPGPKRGEGTWDEFLKRHAVSLWQCDFYAKKALTWRGFRDIYVLIFLHVKTRQVVISPSTFHPNEAWVIQQADAFVDEARSRGHRVAHVQMDSDTKFTKSFRHRLKQRRVKPIKCAFRSPNTNAFVERFIQTLQQECLDYFVTFGTRHMDILCREFIEYYHWDRPHQSFENEPLKAPRRSVSYPTKKNVAVGNSNRVVYSSRLGGLLKSYRNRAA